MLIRLGAMSVIAMLAFAACGSAPASVTDAPSG